MTYSITNDSKFQRLFILILYKMTGCSKHRKIICDNDIECSWVIGKGCKSTIKSPSKASKKSPSKKSSSKKSPHENPLISTTSKKPPTRKMVESYTKKAHKNNVKSEVMLSNENSAVLKTLLHKSGAKLLTRSVAKKYIGKELVMFSDYDFELELHSQYALSALATLVNDALSFVTVTEVTTDEVYYYDKTYGASYANLKTSGENVSRKGYDIMWVWTKKQIAQTSSPHEPHEPHEPHNPHKVIEYSKQKTPQILVTKKSITQAIKKAHEINRQSTVKLSTNLYGYLQDLLQNAGAISFTRGIAKANVNRKIVMFSDYDFGLNSYTNIELSSLDKIVIKMLSHVKVTEVSDAEVHYFDRDYGAKFQLSTSDIDEISRKGYDAMWVWPKHMVT